MFCSKCGKQLEDTKVKDFCPYCGNKLHAASIPKPTLHEHYQPEYSEVSHENVKNYLVESILVTLFCCLPMGIIGIINASKVDSLVAQGQLSEAQSKADTAKNMALIGAIVGGIALIIGFVSGAFGG